MNENGISRSISDIRGIYKYIILSAKSDYVSNQILEQITNINIYIVRIFNNIITFSCYLELGLKSKNKKSYILRICTCNVLRISKFNIKYLTCRH